jgi:uncharacterized protein
MGAVNSPFPLTSPRGTTSRFAFVDISRTFALWGIVVMNYHAYLNGTGSRNGVEQSVWEEIFHPRTGFLTTRFAALFVVVAGISVSLMSNRQPTEDIPRTRVVILRRGILLMFVGSIFEWIWPGTILFYYGAYFLLGAALIRARTWIIVTAAVTSALTATVIEVWRVGQQFDGHYTGWMDPSLVNSPRDLLLRTFIGYTHPVFPWFAFFCAGLLIGRLLPRLHTFRRPIIFSAIAVAIASYAIREIVYRWANEPIRSHTVLRSLSSTDPFDRGVLYTASAMAIATLVVMAAYSWSVSRPTASPAMNALQRIGQFTFTIYIAHALFFNLVVHRLNLVTSTGLDTALMLSAVFALLATVVALWWTHVIGQGPVERCYRWLTG